MTEYSIWLQGILGVAAEQTLEVIEKFGNAQNVFDADYNDLKFSGLFTPRMLEKIKKRDLTAARKVLNDCKKSGIAVIPITSPEYPQLLLQTADPPLVLFAKGNTALLNGEPTVCIVGPRKASSYGLRAAFSLAARLSAGGITVVSGGAVGADFAAHSGALSVGGNTICVFPSGLNSSYLKTNKPLRDKIAANGLLLSEHTPFYELKRGDIPKRNRLMSGLSLGTVVIEAGEKSGALITANTAIEQNRDVFVIPGSPSLPQYAGSNKLIAECARPLLDARNIFEEYYPMFPDKINAEKAYGKSLKMTDNSLPKQDFHKKSADAEHICAGEKSAAATKDGKIQRKNLNGHLSKYAKIVYNNLNTRVFSPDELRVEEIAPSQLLAALGELEIFGYIKALPGGRYEVL